MSEQDKHLRITILNVKDKIVLSFNKPVEYIKLNKNKAIDLSNKIRKKVGQAK